GLQAEVQGQAAGEPVGPGHQGGVAGGVVGEGGLAELAFWQQQAGVEAVLGDVDPDEGGGGRLAHGGPPLWLMNAGSGRAGRPEIASEVEGAGGRAAIWFPRSNASSAACGCSGRRARPDNGGMVTYKPQQTGGS